ncbi:MAG: hypothetical protein QOG03_1536 [Actinomycetota bacterium]|nr:hypothetical protein [Actinomycetota bacterium]
MPALVARRPWAAVVFLVMVGCLAAMAVSPPPARAATTHRALVVVDTGSQVKHRCIGFSSDTITGRQAIDRADVQPVYSGYSAQGTAVCSLCGTGCPADNCFCDPNRYWRYYRQPAGSSSVTYSNQGAGSTTVHDGDVEHWSWATTNTPKPGPDNIDQYCAPVAQATTTSAPSSGGSTGSAGGSSGGPSPAPSRSPGGVGGATTMSPAAGETASTVSASSGATTTARAAQGAEQAAAGGGPRTRAAKHASSAGSVAGFVLALAALVGAVLLARRARRRRTSGGHE